MKAQIELICFVLVVLKARSNGHVLTPADLRSLMHTAWKGRYGDTLVEMDEMFWATKLHFHITDIQFYNFPYTFGYLFALGVYAQVCMVPNAITYKLYKGTLVCIFGFKLLVVHG